jgi:hypothetical protein
MMVGAFLYLPGRYQGASVSKVLQAVCAAVNGNLWLGNNVECREGQPVAAGGLNGRQQKGELGSPRI